MSRLGSDDRNSLAVWLLSRATVALTALAGSFVLTDANFEGRPSWLRGWYHWDVALYIKVARYGYGGYPVHYPDRGIAAFFPGFPLLLKVVHFVVPNWTAAGLLISLVAGGVACIALSRLAVLDGAPGSAAVLALVVSPYAVFLAAGYSEALFLALALPAWLAARRRAWVPAGLLTATACTARVTGLFLAAGVLVHYFVTDVARTRRIGWEFLVLLAPAIPVGLFMLRLHAISGDWLAWPHAESHNWGRHFTWPWTALHTTWHGATVSGQAAEFGWQYRADIVAVALGIVLTLVLLYLRRWGESTYVGLQVGALATSSYYLSVGRATLLWWPLWIGLGRLSRARPMLFWTYLALAAPLMVITVVGFTSGRWVG